MEYWVPLGLLTTIQEMVGLFFGKSAHLLMFHPWWIDQFRHVMFISFHLTAVAREDRSRLWCLTSVALDKPASSLALW